MVHETPPSDTLPIAPATPVLRSKRTSEKLHRGMSIVDHDIDLEDDNGTKKAHLKM